MKLVKLFAKYCNVEGLFSTSKHCRTIAIEHTISIWQKYQTKLFCLTMLIRQTFRTKFFIELCQFVEQVWFDKQMSRCSKIFYFSWKQIVEEICSYCTARRRSPSIVLTFFVCTFTTYTCALIKQIFNMTRVRCRSLDKCYEVRNPIHYTCAMIKQIFNMTRVYYRS